MSFRCPNRQRRDLPRNFVSSPNLFQHSNQFDVRLDWDPNEKNQIFFRDSWVDNPQYIPGSFGGVADGGWLPAGRSDIKSDQVGRGYTHVSTRAWSTWPAWDGTTFTRPEPARRATTSTFRQLRNPGYSTDDLRTAAFPPLDLGGLGDPGQQYFLPSDELARPSRSPTTLPRFTAITTSRWALNSST